VCGPGLREIFGGRARPITRPSIVTSAHGFTLRTRLPGASRGGVDDVLDGAAKPICALEAAVVGDDATRVGGGTWAWTAAGRVGAGSVRVGVVSRRGGGVARAEGDAAGVGGVALVAGCSVLKGGVPRETGSGGGATGGVRDCFGARPAAGTGSGSATIGEAEGLPGVPPTAAGFRAAACGAGTAFVEVSTRVDVLPSGGFL
jgi:hypothetical protein